MQKDTAMRTITIIPISEEVHHDIARRAEKLGVSPEEWAANVLSEHIRLPRLTDEFFDRRAQIPSSLTLQ